jgi:hypothetical protein
VRREPQLATAPGNTIAVSGLYFGMERDAVEPVDPESLVVGPVDAEELVVQA